MRSTHLTSDHATLRSFLGVLAAVAAALIASADALAVPEISVANQRQTLFNGSTLDFGSVRQDRSLTQTLTISNEGTSDLFIQGATAGAPFQIGQAPAAVVAPGRRTVVRVVVPSGTSPGVKNADLTITTNDPSEGSFVVRLTTQVLPVAPDAALQFGTTPVASGTTVNLGSTTAGVALRRAFTLVNRGNANLTVSGISATTPFSVAAGRTGTLRPGKRLEMTVAFQASAAGSAIGELRVETNDPDTPTYRVALTADATPANAVLTVFSQGTPVISEDTVFFGRSRSDRRVDRQFTIRNDGSSPLTISAASVSGSGYSLVSMPRSTLARGKTTKFKVRFDAGTSGGNTTGRLTLATNAAGNEAFHVNLATDVQTVNPAIAVQSGGVQIIDGSTFQFGETNLNIGRERTFLISNTGSADLTLGPVMLSGTGYTLTRPPAETVRPGRTTDFVIRLFSMAALDPATGGVSFTTNDPMIPTFDFMLSGAVRVPVPMPEVEVSTTITNAQGTPINVNVPNNSTQNFGSTPAGDPITRNYRVRNVGNADLTLGSVMVTGANFGPAMQMLPMTLPPGMQATFAITYSPATPGPSSGTASFTTNDADENPFTFNLLGNATTPNQLLRVTYAGIEIPRRPASGPTPPPFSLGAIAGGNSVFHTNFTQPIRITNLGDAAMCIQTMSLVPPTGIDWIFIDPATTPILCGPPDFGLGPPLPRGQSMALNLRHDGIFPGASTARVRFINTFSLFSPFEFDIVEWVLDWFETMGGLGGGAVRALMDFDADGGGPGAPILVAGGEFNNPMSRIAALNGNTWEALAGGGVNDGEVRALAVFDEDGTGPNPPRLFAAGSFTSVGSPALAAMRIGRWNGNAWSVVGVNEASNGVGGGNINAMIVFDPDGAGGSAFSPELYVGGAFLTVAGIPGNTIALARWNGMLWRRHHDTVPSVSGGVINAMATFDEDEGGPNPARLFVAGTFTSAGDNVRVNRIARWDGANWTPVGPGFGNVTDRVNAMAVIDIDGPGGQPPVLVVAGNFVDVRDPAAPTMPGTLLGVNNIAQWTGQLWQRLALGLFPGEVFALAVFDEDGFIPDNQGQDTTRPPRLYAAGDFSVPLPDGGTAERIARWDGTRWSLVGTPAVNGTDGTVFALRVFDPTGAFDATPGRLFVGGTFTMVTHASPLVDVPVPVNNVAVWGASAP